ncbi:copper homeostasis protein CutC [Bacteroidia bacterium]|nr:copper homeostasis protein CutC [Bacteroidia bacterium]GHT82844.1 copper homeostasis protein CutC [Bacteroidia bacterium]
MVVEVCTDSLAGANIAQQAGAYRIELCAALSEGGVTPSLALISMVRQSVGIRVYVLIRPRSGDFLYSDAEYEIMKADIRYCGQNKCDGVVIGILRADGSVDKNRCRELVHIAQEYGMGVTFHRAFDRSNDLPQAMEDVIETGCERILTSGGYETAIEGADVIRTLTEKAGNRIVIMAGAGITPDNARDLVRATGIKELHGTFRSRSASKMLYRNTNFARQDEEYEILLNDIEKIKLVNNE